LSGTPKIEARAVGIEVSIEFLKEERVHIGVL